MKLRIAVLSLLALFSAGLSLGSGLEARSLSEEEQVLWVGTGAFRDGFYEVAEKQFTHFLKDHASHPRVHDVSYLLVFFHDNGKSPVGRKYLFNAFPWHYVDIFYPFRT